MKPNPERGKEFASEGIELLVGWEGTVYFYYLVL